MTEKGEGFKLSPPITMDEDMQGVFLYPHNPFIMEHIAIRLE